MTLSYSVALTEPRWLMTLHRPIATQAGCSLDLRADRPEGVVDGFDVTPDGQHFVMLESAETPNESRVLNVVQNWFAEFKDKQR